MFDGGQAATATRSDVSVTGSGSQADVHRADRRMRSDSDSGQGLGGVFGIGVRSNSIGGEEPEDDDVSVLRFYDCTLKSRCIVKSLRQIHVMRLKP